MRKSYQIRLWLPLLLVGSGFLSNCNIFKSSKSEKPKAVVGPALTDEARKLKLVWISLDNLRYSDLEKYSASLQNPHPKGFRSLLKNSNWNRALQMSNPTITASSHISTITCTPPGVHGIIANSQFDASFEKVSGFNKPYPAENFVAALVKAGLRVGSIGYPSIDGIGEERQATFGLGYPTAKISDGKVLQTTAAEELPFTFATRAKGPDGKPLQRNATAQFNTGTGELTLKIESEATPLIVKVGEWANFKFDEDGKKSLVSFLFSEVKGGNATLYVSPVTANNAHPEAYQKHLDAEGLVFSGGKDGTQMLFQTGKVSPKLYLQSLEHRLEYFTKAAMFTVKKEFPEALFLYMEDLDVLGHQFEGDAAAEELRAQHFAKVDAALGEFLTAVPEDANVVMLGDHGMSAMNYTLNTHVMLDSATAGQFRFLPSGGALFLYSKDQKLESYPSPTDENVEKAIKQLKDFQVEFDGGRKAFAEVVMKGTKRAEELGLEGPEMPWIMAFANPGIALSYQAKTATENPILLLNKRKTFEIEAALLAKYAAKSPDGKVLPMGQPGPLGSHGHIASSAEMRSALLFSGPLLSKIEASSIATNLQLVPAVADALGFPRPEGCRTSK